MENKVSELKRKKYGAFETPVDIFNEYILPKIKNKLNNYLWVDLYCGKGNLILPILSEFPEGEKRISFFEKHIFLFDILPEMIEGAIKNAMILGIPENIAKKNIQVRDTLKNFPEEILHKGLPVFHITNPPYMYLGYIRKNEDFKSWLEYFKGEKEGYQDLYQLALMNDLKHNITKMIYVMPSNFLFGASVSNKIRKDFLFTYNIKEALVFERRIFEFTGQHVGIFFFERKTETSHQPQTFELRKINQKTVVKIITIKPERLYRAGDEFSEFVERYKAKIPLEIKYYLFINEVLENKGENKIIAVDSNEYSEKGYNKKGFSINKDLLNKIKQNILFIKTVDGVHEEDKAGLYEINEIFDADCIIVSKAPYRTHPIQLFFIPSISIEEQKLLKNYFNLLLEFFRKKTDSEFMTTYKYSNAPFTRKYLGLSQAKKLIQTFPLLELDKENKNKLKELIDKKDCEGIISFLRIVKQKNNLI